MEQKLCNCLRCGKAVEDVEYVRYGGCHLLCAHAEALDEKKRQYELEKKKYQFVPAYYEWHLVDEKGKVIYNMIDPSEDCYDGNGEPLTLDELRSFIDGDIRCQTEIWEEKDPDYPSKNLLVSPDELPECADEIMTQALYDYYCAA